MDFEMKGTRKKDANILLVHLLAWLILFGMPLFLTRPDRPMVNASQYLHFILTATSFMVVFYVNWLVLIKKNLFSHKIGRFLLWNLLLIAVVLIAMRFMSAHILPPPPFKPEPKPHSLIPGFRFLVGNTCLYLLVVGASVAIKMTSEWYAAEASRKEAEKNFTEAELQNLKSQLNPHFLFNTLNNIYSLIQIDTDRAQNAVHDLSRTLRYVLYESSNPTVPVRSEIEFLGEYIALMKMRIPRHVKVDISMPEDGDPVMNKEIAPMLFISLVENAFKHGVSNEQESFIELDIHADGNRLVCRTRNSNFPKSDSDRSGSGIGLDNLRKRLAMIYPEKHTFTCGADGDVYESKVEIEL